MARSESFYRSRAAKRFDSFNPLCSSVFAIVMVCPCTLLFCFLSSLFSQ
ncbi:unnamed protein product, partial [Brassica rapa subsp. trilocularis]